MTHFVRRLLRDDRGQAVVMTVLGMGLFGLMAIISIDVGLLMTDRRDAQSDVDKMALAGALELTLEPGDAAADTAAATAAAQSWAARNGVDLSTVTIQVVSNCYTANDGYPTGVLVSLVRPPDTLFVDNIGVTDWNTKTDALACAGRPNEMTGFLPFALSETSPCFHTEGGEYVPNLGEMCDIEIDTNSTGLSGQLGLDPGGDCWDGNPSASVLKDNIINGAQVTCTIGDSVQGGPGHSVGPTKDGIETRLAAEGACETNYADGLATFNASNAALNAVAATDLHSPSRTDGMDDFYEVWARDPSAAHPAGGLLAYDCSSADGLQTSPRNVVLIIVHDALAPDGDEGPKSYEVQGFARMYVEGCTRSGTFYKDCDWGGGGKFFIHARFVQQVNPTNSDLNINTTFGDVEVFLKD